MRLALRRLLTTIADLVLISLATVLALTLRDDFQFTIQRLVDVMPHLFLTALIAAVALPLSGISRAIWRYTSATEYVKIFGVAVLSVVGAMAIGFSINRLDNVPRSLPILQILLIVVLLGTVRFVAKQNYRSRERRTAQSRLPESIQPRTDQQAVLVVGLNALTDLFLQSVAEVASDHVKIVGLLGRQERHTGRSVQGYPVLGTPDQIVDVLRDLDVHGVTVERIVVTVPFHVLSHEARQALLEVERTSSVRLEFVSQMLGLDERSAPVSIGSGNPADGNALFCVNLAEDEQRSISKRSYWSWKRMVDIGGALSLLVLGAPLILVIAIVVAFDLGLPTVFWQQRPGALGRPFRLYKFRTMSAAHDRYGRRIADERRSSAIGRALRRFRLDELPQLYNIVVGHMSFVGPRPLLPIDQPAGTNPRLLVRPGLTGWAQVSGGRGISVSDKTVLDVWYLRHASIALDFRIMIRTVEMVLRGERRDDRAIRAAYCELDMMEEERGSPDNGAVGASDGLHSAR